MPSAQELDPDLLRRAAARLIEYPFDVWRTGDAVGLEGLIALSRQLDEPSWRSWAHGFLKAWSARAQPYRESDDTAAGRPLCMVFEEEGDGALLKSAIGLADYIASRRTIDGTCVFRESTPLREPFGPVAPTALDLQLIEDPGPCILMNWLQMPLGYLAYLGTLTHNRSYVDFAATQGVAQLRVLQDESGLLWHFWLEKTGNRYGLGWGRGQAWSLLGLMDLLEFLPKSRREYDEICTAARRLAEAIAAHQLEDGTWRAVLIDDASPIESSTACFAVAAFMKGVDLGVLEDRFVGHSLRAWDSVCERVGDDGVLQDVSGNIGASTAASHYGHAPLGVVVPWGQGPLLLAAATVSRFVER